MLKTKRVLCILPLLTGSAVIASAGMATFNFTNGQQNFIVPSGVTSVTIQASGGQGGGVYPGLGGSVTATLSTTPGETLYVFVGSRGGLINLNVGLGGSNGGGGAEGGDGRWGGLQIQHKGAGGGGASDVRRGGTALANRVVVAGGGGGTGGTGGNTTAGGGGGGGGSTGGPGYAGEGTYSGAGGQGGTQIAGGTGGQSNTPESASPAYDGQLGLGGFAGDDGAYGGGGGGGGYYGGGGGQGSYVSAPGISSTAGGGGGGASFATDSNAVFVRGDHAGDGVVVISWIACLPPTITTLTASPNQLWPPNHKMTAVTLSDIISGGCGAVSCKIISVSSSEPVDPDNDWEITGDLSLNLRAERIASRLGPTNGRVYTLTVQCTDAAGNTTPKTVTVRVPLNQ